MLTRKIENCINELEKVHVNTYLYTLKDVIKYDSAYHNENLTARFFIITITLAFFFFCFSCAGEGVW